MRVVKPTRRRGQELRDLPLYTISEAAQALAIPARTFFSWFVGPYRVYRPAAEYQHYSLLSFRDVAEAYRLYVLREFHGMSPRTIRRQLAELRKETQSKHPLLDSDVRLVKNAMYYYKHERSGAIKYVRDLSSKGGQLALQPVIDEWSKRIILSAKGEPLRVLPWRLLATDRESTPVSIDPEVMSGNLVVKGTRIPVSILKGMKLSGKEDEDIARAYRLSVEEVQKALLHLERPSLQKVA